MKVVAFLPAKGNSERIESKNLKLLDGKPLFLHTLEKLVQCDFIDEVYLDSDSDIILDYAPYLKYRPLKRESSLATNKTDGHQLFYNEICQIKADIYIQVLATSPFIKPDTIKRGVDVLINHAEYDSVVLVKREKQYTWNDQSANYDADSIPNSKDLPDTIIETMGLYIIRSESAHNRKKRIGEHPYLLEASAIEAIDVNYPDDFELAETIARGVRQKESGYFRFLANHLSSAFFSDILWDLGVNDSVISGLKLNLPNHKILGRANTLRIRPLDENENYNGIYKGLDTYSEMRPGEIIVVENACPDRAYFGDLNCNLAIRAGAIGTIINGVTRDIDKVTALNYPVFSKGYCCADVRGFATIESHNQVIHLNGVEVLPGDLVFADINGVVIIPQKLETAVLERVITTIKTEKTVIEKIINDVEGYKIYMEEGAF